jgi:pimeloyl-ACP methyl ester carboxylesterase
VLGRARGGGYTCLSEADVLDAVDYIQAHWNIDAAKIHLTGASMGGGGTFKLASRYPDRWASGRPVCGYGPDQPILNALHVPLYATHSQDDPTVPILASRAPLQKLLKAGGQVIVDETNGLQHASWNYVDGNRRGQEWFINQVRPDFREVRRIDYTAVDRKASRAYWLQITEWGGLPGSARFRAEAGAKNELYLVLDNIQTLRIAVADAPFDQSQNLRVSVNGGVFTDFPAPLPDSLFVNHEKEIWSVNADVPHRADFALRTPGGIYNLYAGEPLLIVYGTAEDDSSNKSMARAAEAASKSMNPMWVGDGGDIKDGVPSHHILYGRLKTKPDTSVTAQDLADCNLVLIGRADENRLVAKIADRLPVKFGKEIVCSDGTQMPRDRAVLGLYYYNPLAPRRLIYWVAADQPASYRPYPFLLQIQNDSPVGTDLLVTQDNPPKIVRCWQFDSRWNWSTVFSESALIDGKDATYGAAMSRIAESMRKAVGADYTLMQMSMPPQFEILSPGMTHWLDVALLDMTTSLAVMQVTGAELATLRQETLKSESGVQLLPASDDKYADAQKTYRVVMSASFDKMQQVIQMLNHVPSDFTISDVTLFEAMKQTLF